MVEWFQQGANVRLGAQPVEPHGIQPLEDVESFAVAGVVAVLFDKSLDFLKSSDDAFLARGAHGILLRLDLNAKLRQQGIIVIGEAVSHGRPPPSCGPGRRHLRPCAFPMRRAT